MAGLLIERRLNFKGVGQEGREKCLGSGDDPNWAAEPLVMVVSVKMLFLRSFL
jgi:hypothetical protein